MKQTLLNLFKPYKPVKEVTAHRNVRMRGQAFVTFPDVELANRARREVEQFPLYGKPMVCPSSHLNIFAHYYTTLYWDADSIFLH